MNSRPSRRRSVTRSAEVEGDLQRAAVALSSEYDERVPPLVEPERVREHVPYVDAARTGPVEVVRDRVPAYAIKGFHAERVGPDQRMLLEVPRAPLEPCRRRHARDDQLTARTRDPYADLQ